MLGTGGSVDNLMSGSEVDTERSMSPRELDSARKEDDSKVSPPEEEYKDKGPALVRLG